MRIGLFTDTYRPSINGIVFVVESLQTHLEAMGHEVYVFCPARSVRPSKTAERFDEDEYIIRFPSVKGAFYDDYDTSFFFPPRVMMQVRELDLDMIHILTPGQVGLMGIQAAWVNKVPFVIQHCTDLYEFVEHYPAVLPGALALITLVVPFTVRLQGKDIKELIKLYRPRRGATEWNQDIIEKAMTIVYSKADAVITLSRKSTDQLASWQQGDKFKYPLVMMPNGVDPIKPASASELKAFRKRWNIDEQDEVYGFVGRLGEEKNLPVLIEALGTVLK
ncbi:MAG: glycosyltransferase, partial [Candidatus Saccharimonadales bacterium]